jgi:hypothetical protein
VAKPPGLRLLRSIVRAGNAHQRALTKLFTTSAPTYGKPRKAPSGNNDHKAGHDTRRENTFPNRPPAILIHSVADRVVRPEPSRPAMAPAK